jgi:hypothetical protein
VDHAKIAYSESQVRGSDDWNDASWPRIERQRQDGAPQSDDVIGSQATEFLRGR